MKLSKRAESVPASPMRKLVPYAEQAEKRGIKVYYVNIGQPDIKTPPIFYEIIEKHKPEVLAYSVSPGRDELRMAMLKYYDSVDINLEYEHINITVGGSEAIQFAIALTCDSGDEILVFEPYYANYNSMAKMMEVKLVPVTTHSETGYHFPGKEKIVEKITPKTKAILFCNPNNPTGTVFTEQEIKMLGKIVEQHDLFLIGDEVYREFVYDGLKSTSVMSLVHLKDRVILVDSLSKRFSLCGARVGCLVSRNEMIMKSLLKMEQSRLSAPTLEGIGGVGALNLPKSYHNKVNTEYCKRRNIVYEALQKIEGVECKLPEGAFYVFAKFPVKDAEKFAKWMLTSFDYEEKTVMIAPGHGFYGTENLGMSEIRIAYILNSIDLKKAMTVLEVGLKSYIDNIEM